MLHSGDDDIHSDLSVKKEENKDILEPRCSGRKYIKISNVKYFLRPNVLTVFQPNELISRTLTL